MNSENIIPLVSIVCLTYNHEKYIAEALDSFLMQKTDFEFEVIVHDDASTDNTQTIIREYEKKVPNIIKPIYQKENQKSKGNGIVTKIAFNAAKGKYIALCEGDDYWIDPLKLNKQIDFLEKEMDTIMIFHNAIVCDLDERREYIFNGSKSVLNPKKLDESRYVERYELLNNWIVPTASVVFRNQLTQKLTLPDKDYYGDILIFLELSTQGKVYYLNEVMSVYRKLTTGYRKKLKSNRPAFIEHFSYIKKIYGSSPSIAQVCYKYLSILYLKEAIHQLLCLNFKLFFINNRNFLKVYINFLATAKVNNAISGTLYIIKNILFR